MSWRDMEIKIKLPMTSNKKAVDKYLESCLGHGAATSTLVARRSRC